MNLSFSNLNSMPSAFELPSGNSVYVQLLRIASTMSAFQVQYSLNHQSAVNQTKNGSSVVKETLI